MQAERSSNGDPFFGTRNSEIDAGHLGRELGIVTQRPGPFFLAGRLLHGPGSACVFVSAQALALHSGGALHGGRAAGTVRAAIVLGVPVGLLVDSELGI